MEQIDVLHASERSRIISVPIIVPQVEWLPQFLRVKGQDLKVHNAATLLDWRPLVNFMYYSEFCSGRKKKAEHKCNKHQLPFREERE